MTTDLRSGKRVSPGGSRRWVGALALGALATAIATPSGHTMGAKPLSSAATPTSTYRPGPAQPETTRSIWDGVYTTAQATRGRVVYERECSECHGPALGGTDDVPPLSGEAFIANWTDSALDFLYDVMSVTMPDSNPGGLSRAEYGDILAFILQANAAPPGDDELEPTPEALQQVQIVTRPQ